MSAHQMAVEIQQELRRLPGNNRCVDCDAPYPQWATVSYGTFMCLECSGRHRGLGVHLSFVRSVTMDSWTDKQILHMQRGGNDAFREAFAAAGVPTTLSIQDKYNTPQAEAFRARLNALVDGRSAMPLPRWDPSCLKSSNSSGASSSGHAAGDTRGVEALKGETEEAYVARQMRLKEEARARMQAKFGSGGMQGIGSGGETRAPVSNGGIADLSSAFGFLTTTVASAATTAVSLVKDKDLGSKVSSSWSYVQSSLGDPALTQNVKETASSGWSALAGGASAVWQKATTGQVQSSSSSGGDVPRFNGALAPSGKYSGVGNDRFGSSTDDHDNDSWLDAQLKTSPPKANSFNGLGSKPTAASSHSASFSSSSSSSSLSYGQSYSAPSSSNSYSTPASTATPLPSAPLPAPVSAPLPTPAPAPPAKKKKDVDFFAEFGF